jgi:hypothetical protein
LNAFTVQPFAPGDLREYVMDSSWRLFAELWDTVELPALQEHALLFPRLVVIESVPEYPDAVLTFAIDSQRFAVIRSQSEYLFFVENPECDAELLLAVARHFNSLLCRILSVTFVTKSEQRPRGVERE